MVKNPPASAADMGLTPGPGRLHMPRGNGARVPQPLTSTHPGACSARREAAAVGSQRTPAGEWHPLAAAGWSPHSSKDPRQPMGNELKPLKSFHHKKMKL